MLSSIEQTGPAPCRVLMRKGVQVDELITKFAPPEIDRRHIDISHRGTAPRPFRTESIHGRVKLSKPKAPKPSGPRVAWNRGMGLKRDDVDRLRADGRTVVQIAERLGCSRGAVYACIHREKSADPMAAEVAYEAATCPKCGGRKWACHAECSRCRQNVRRRVVPNEL